MTKVQIPERATRPYTAPRLIRPEAEGLSPEGKFRFDSVEFTPTVGVQYAPS